MRTQTLQQLVASAKGRADLVRSNFVSTAEWVEYINAGIVELWNELREAYGEEYSQLYYPFTTIAQQDQYDLPTAMWSLKAVELQIGGLWYPVHRFGMPDRLQFQMLPAIVSGARLNNLKYALWGFKLKLIPVPDGAYNMRLVYEPPSDRLATNLVVAANVNTGTNTLNIPSHGLRADQLVQPGPGSASIGAGGTISSGLRADTFYWVNVIDKDNVQLFATAAGEGPQIAPGDTPPAPVPLGSAGTGTWILDGVLDGIAGWEEWPILSAAIKALAKEESDTTALEKQLYGVEGTNNEGAKGMIRAAAKQRDSAEPKRITNVHAPFAMDAYLLGEF